MRSACLTWMLYSSAWLCAQSVPEYELAPIEYSESTADNQVTTLQKRLDSGNLEFSADQPKALVRSLLKALEIPEASQVLVFSRTSLQRDRIRPDHPRAIYFSDDVYLGWVPGGLVEVAVTDPRLGVVFYQFDPNVRPDAYRFERDNDCLSCHAGTMTDDWPGLMVRSVFPNERGDPILSAGTYLTGHESPLEERWGGWYVTGTHGDARHMGNVIATETGSGAELDPEPGANLTDLSGFFAPDRYLRGDSDIVALMVLEHQVNMHNRLAKGGLRARRWLDYQRQLQETLGEPTDQLTGTARRVIESEADEIVSYLLFEEELWLPPGGVDGNEAFQTAFQQQRRTDSEGRSLKEFQLRTRLFQYRCSYMIYSRAFDAMPDPLKQEIYRRLQRALDVEDRQSRFDYMSKRERRAIAEILTATRPELAASWGVDR